MSLDIALVTPGKRCEHCGGETVPPVRHADLNITHNVGLMWRRAGVWEALYESDGTKAAQWLPVLREGLADMAANANDYLPLSPPNGWGSYAQALAFLQKWVEACELNPDAVIDVSR